jgi:hypothetical protein
VGERRTGRYNAPDQTDRMTVPEAAAALGITAEAVRMRIKRGTLRSERESGHVYVLLDAEQTRPNTDRPTDRTDTLVGALQDQIETLKRQLEQANERDRENRRILAALTQRIPAIEAPAEPSSETPESPAGATEQPGRVEPQRAVEEPDVEPGERVSWWRRVFGE